MIINLISGPRNVSTALLYSFAQRSDTIVFDEPFYAVYLQTSGANHPGKELVLKSMPTEESEVRDRLISQRQKPVCFVKNMAHHMEVLNDPFLDGAINIFLIRDPHQILASYAEVIEQPAMRDIGLAYQYALFSRLESQGDKPLVVDSGFLLDDPAAVLKKICAACGLPFEHSMTHWPAGPKPYDGVWAPYWYVNVHTTTGFQRQPTSKRALPSHLQSLCREAQYFYEKLLPFSVKA